MFVVLFLFKVPVAAPVDAVVDEVVAEPAALTVGLLGKEIGVGFTEVTAVSFCSAGGFKPVQRALPAVLLVLTLT